MSKQNGAEKHTIQREQLIKDDGGYTLKKVIEQYLIIMT